tara:strand:+ start:923 stop:2932 length:2010 start_codon:yes stop_codon:yes gene_type:complete
MATSDELDNASKAAKELNAEFNAINNALTDLTSKLINVVETTEGFDAVTKRTANTFQKDLSKALDNVKKNNESIVELQTKQVNGAKLTASEQKKLDVLLKRQASDRVKAENALNNLRGEGVNISVELELQIQEQLDTSEALGASAQQLNTDLVAQDGILGNIVDNAKEYLLSLDKSGLASELLSGNLNKAQKGALLGEAALIAIANAALAGSDNINNLQKNLGISYGSAYQLQNELALTAASSEKLFITSKALNESFSALAETTGILSDFGGDTLVTMTTLTKQLGLGVKEASQLALLARTQGTDTESILENTVDTVNAVNRQRGAAISAKAVLNDIATASASIVVSLGMSPELIAEAATEARALGTTLSQLDAIAGSLLDFESSIENELTFQMLTGKQINLDKARQLALDNDMAGFAEEIANNAEITEAFTTGNRIQQEAAANALGMSRDSMADMVMQQSYLNMGQDEFIEKFGEQSYQSMQSQSASEKFAASLEKIQGIIGDIGIIFSPIIDGFASLVGYLASSKPLLAAIAATMTVMAVQSAFAARAKISEAIGSIFTSFGSIPFGLGVPLAFGAAAGLLALTKKTQTVADGIAPSSKGPFTITDSYGAMATTTAGDSLMASPNVGKGGGDSKMVALLEKIANKDSNVYMDSSKVGTSMAMATSRI